MMQVTMVAVTMGSFSVVTAVFHWISLNSKSITFNSNVFFNVEHN